MTFTPERTTINQRPQIALESTHGTSVPASKMLECFDWTLGINGDIQEYGATGHKYNTVQEENTEWVDLTATGELDYNGVIYLLSGAMGAVSPVASNSGAATLAKDWIFIPPLTGSIDPATFTIEQGDAVRAHKVSYALISGFDYALTRKQVTVSAKGISRPLQDGITLTSSPTAIALAPAVGKHFNVYIDPTYAALGTTQLTKALAVNSTFDGVYGPFWPINRANVGFTSHVDLKPASRIKLKVEADSQGMALLTSLQVGTTQFVRVQAQGALIDNNQTVALGAASAGNFTLTYKGQTTGNIAYNALASAVQTAFTGLSTVGVGNATVTGSTGGPYIINFAGTLASDLTAVTGTPVSLTGGTFVITQTQVYNGFTHDIAIKIGKPSTFSDDSGIFAIEWDCPIVEDSGWGNAQKVTATNLITAL